MVNKLLAFADVDAASGLGQTDAAETVGGRGFRAALDGLDGDYGLDVFGHCRAAKHTLFGDALHTDGDRTQTAAKCHGTASLYVTPPVNGQQEAGSLSRRVGPAEGRPVDSQHRGVEDAALKVGLPLVGAAEHVLDGVCGGFGLGEHGLARDGLAIGGKLRLALAEVYGLAGGVAGVTLGHLDGQSAHVAPAGGGDADAGGQLRVDERGLRRVAPGTAQVGGDSRRRSAGHGGDVGVAEDVAPLGVDVGGGDDDVR